MHTQYAYCVCVRPTGPACVARRRRHARLPAQERVRGTHRRRVAAQHRAGVHNTGPPGAGRAGGDRRRQRRAWRARRRAPARVLDHGRRPAGAGRLVRGESRRGPAAPGRADRQGAAGGGRRHRAGPGCGHGPAHRPLRRAPGPPPGPAHRRRGGCRGRHRSRRRRGVRGRAGAGRARGPRRVRAALARPVRSPPTHPPVQRRPDPEVVVMPVLEMQAVVKRYGAGHNEVLALDHVSLVVEPGEVVAVMGPSGSGKSTVLHLAGGLEAPTTGTVLVDGRDVATLSAVGLADLRRRKVGFVFQRLNLVPSLTAAENVALPLEFDGLPRRAARREADAALERVGLPHPYDRFPDDLSGGEQQRVAIARALAGPRVLVLADEPTGALDTVTGDLIVELLAAQAAGGTGVVLVTHEPRYASWADRVVFLRDGAVVDEAVAAPAPSSEERRVGGGC